MISSSAGATLPVSDFAASIVGEFPRINRQRHVESSISGKTVLDILPVNLSSHARLKDKYLEFRVPGVKGAFLDLAKLILEIKLSVTQPDGQTKLEDDVNIDFSNGTANTMFKSIQVYVGDQMVESNPFFNYWSFIKMITTFSSLKLKSFGELGNLLKDKLSGGGGIAETYDASYFTNLSNKSKTHLKNIKDHGLHLTFPIMSDVASCDQYLCDDIPVRIRMELANESWFVNTDGDGSTIRAHIDFAKLWVTRLQPYPAALQALNRQMELGKTSDSLFNKTLYKSLVLGKQQTSLVCDQPWGNVIPERLYVIMTDMTSFSGAYNKNGLYFKSADLSELTVSVNGMNLYKNTVSFPHECSQLFYNVVDGLGIENDTLLDYESFKRGRSLFVYTLLAEDVQGTVPLEHSGNLRVSLQLKKGIDTNIVILMFGDTKGVLSVNSERHVTCSSRA